MIQNPVTRLCFCDMTLNNGISFTIVHDLKQEGGNKSFKGEYERWIKKTRNFTALSFIRSVKNHQPNSIFLLKEDYDKIVEGEDVIPATKDEYDAENN